MIGELTNNLIDTVIFEIKKKDTKEKINKEILDPIIQKITNKLYPYIIATILIFILMTFSVNAENILIVILL